MPRRVMCVWLPMWSIDLVRRAQRRLHGSEQDEGLPAETDAPPTPGILLIATSGNQQHIAHCCEHAAAAGVKRGMSLAHARALLPLDGVIVEEHNPARELQRLKSLASWAMRFTPVVSIDPPDGLLLDVTGCERLHRGERRLLNAVANSIEWLGFRVRIAAASNFACARAVARYGERTLTPTPPTFSLGQSPLFVRPSSAEGEGVRAHVDRFIVVTGDELDALRDLPIEGLRLEQEVIDALHEVNIDRIGHLTCLPRNDLAARFGRDVLLRLDQAMGDTQESVEPQRSIATPRVARAFDGPVKQVEGIAITVQELIVELCAMLRNAESGVRRLDVDFERIDAANLRETVMLSRPSRDAKHLWSLLRPHVEKVNLGFGVEKIAISASRTGRLPHGQIEHWTRGDSSHAAIERVAGELIDTLANRLGSERITRAVLVESHLPERAFRHEPATGEERSATSRQQSVINHDRPTVLFAIPELIEVMSIAPEGPPQWLRRRGEEYSIVFSDGPERIGEEWWRSVGSVLAGVHGGVASLPARDYFRVHLDDGRWLWVYRQLEGGQWFVHGEWT